MFSGIRQIKLFHNLKAKLDGEHVPLLQFLFRFWFIRLTLTGRSVLIGGISLAYAGMVTGTFGRSLYLFWFLIITAIVSIVIGFFLKPKIKITRMLPDGVTVGREFSATLTIQNKKSSPVYELEIFHKIPKKIKIISSPGIKSLHRNKDERLTHTLMATSRGVFHLKKLYALSSFPFGVWNAIQNLEAPHLLTVYPSFTPLETLDIPVGVRYQPGGVALTSNIGESNEFLGIREYREGDNLRHIHAPSWARRCEPIVKVFQEEYFCRIAVVLDTYLPATMEDSLEAAVSLSAAIADSLAHKEYIIDLFAAGPDLYFLESGRSLAYLKNILEILACVEPCKTSPFITLGPAVSEYLSRTTTVILLLLDWDKEREKFVQFCQESGAAVKLTIVSDQETSIPPPDFAILLNSKEAAGVSNL